MLLIFLFGELGRFCTANAQILQNFRYFLGDLVHSMLVAGCKVKAQATMLKFRRRLDGRQRRR